MTTTIIKPTKDTARKVAELVSHGLTHGLGVQEPGKMCVEAAVCLALGLPHGDDPPCVSRAVRSFKIALNDSSGWSSNKTRACGLKRLAVAQLGSNEIDDALFVKELALATVRKIVPIALRAAAKLQGKEHADKLEAHAVTCEDVKTLDTASYAASDAASDASDAARAASDAASDAARAARAASDAASYASYAARAASDASDAASYAAKDKVLSIMAECAVEALIKCKSPGCAWLDLCD